jgi:hypothetical protein
MKKSQIISLSKKISNRFTKSYPTAIFNNLNSDPFLKQIPFSSREKIIFSFLVNVYKEGFDPELFYDEIENNLFKVVFEFVDKKGVEVDCSECETSGMVDCSMCMVDGSGNVECPDCDGEGEVWDYDDEVSEPCQTCYGGGEVECEYCDGSAEEECPSCNGGGAIYFEGGIEYSEWHVYSWDKEFSNKFELMNYDEIISPALYDDFWDNDKTLWIENANGMTDTDSRLNQHDAVLIDFEKI